MLLPLTGSYVSLDPTLSEIVRHAPFDQKGSFMSRVDQGAGLVWPFEEWPNSCKHTLQSVPSVVKPFNSFVLEYRRGPKKNQNKTQEHNTSILKIHPCNNALK